MIGGGGGVRFLLVERGRCSVAETLKSVQVILAETSHVEYNKGAPSTVEMLSFFDSIGFQVFDIVEVHRKYGPHDSRRQGHGIMFQVDFIFVRKGSAILDAAVGYWHEGGRRAVLSS